MGGVKREQRLRGIPASPPLAIGRVYFFDRKTSQPPPRRLEPEEIPGELSRFDAALAAAEAELSELQERFGRDHRGDHSLILDAHRMMLRDPLLVEGTRERISGELLAAEWALRRTLAEIQRAFDAISDDYLRARKSDVDFVGERILRCLAGGGAVEGIGRDAVVVAADIGPADVVSLSHQRILGLATAIGGQTSHTAIVARALEIPAVVGVDGLIDAAAEGDLVIVDGLRGEVILNPTPQRLAETEARRARYLAFGREILKNRDLPARTTDGAQVVLRANVELDEETPSVLIYGAGGVGLYRTEFLYMNRQTLPTEEEHLAMAKAALEHVAPHPITFRTLDLGGDKRIDPAAFAGEGVFAMGLRAIRLCLQQPEIFRAQLRGLLLASAYGPMRIMFPLITGVAEFRDARAIVEAVREELAAEGYDLPPVPLGAMVETPGAVLVADALAREADFLCVGTNDLIQYTLAVDRADEAVAEYYRPLHPAILRMLKATVEAGRSAKIPVSICGEMAGEPMYAAILLGLGFDEMSMNAASVPAVKHVIRSLSYADAVIFTRRILSLPTSREVEALVEAFMRARFPELFSADLVASRD
jgi:phosphotransferase system enzyme I (PtsI)